MIQLLREIASMIGGIAGATLLAAVALMTAAATLWAFFLVIREIGEMFFKWKDRRR